MDILKDKVYVIISKWCYPFGGGEEFLYQSMAWADKLGMHTYWVCFSTSANTNFDELYIEKHEHGTIIKVPDGFSKGSLKLWLKLLKPDFVHHQGHLRKEFYEVCSKLRVPFLSGFHFWHGAITMDPEKLNVEMIKHYKLHKTDPELDFLYGRSDCHLYCASRFVTECIKKVTGYDIPDQIFASSSYKKIKLDSYDVLNAEHVLVINIHKLKGGEIFFYLLENCKNIPFCCIKTESYSEGLDKKIEEAIKARNVDPSAAPCTILNRLQNPKTVYQNTKIMLAPSLADETFCRTVNEAMMNGIPVITSGHGNIKYLVGDAGYTIPVTNFELWKHTVESLYFNTDELVKQSKLSLENYLTHSERVAYKQFRNISTKVLEASKELNIMIFTPWCDQGLGIQSRNYMKLLDQTKYKTNIFAIKPYNADTCLELQKNPEEWLIDNIYYSPNDREKVKDIEIINFVKQYNIGRCLIPETCWYRVFEIARLLKSLNVKCYAIPNIEIVRKDEIFKHRYFHKILCNNYLCESIFKNHGLNNTEYVGYAVSPTDVPFKNKSFNGMVKFLFIGGMNAFSRKHILEICDAFRLATKSVDNIHLTCTIQKINLLEEEDRHKIEKFMDHPNITIIQKHLKYSEIVDLYHNSHVSIQVSKHEGLGIGFYETIAAGTPVITLDTPPHNEIILDGVNGWIIPCYYKPMVDNKDPNFDSAYFYPDILAKKIVDISKGFDKSYSKLVQKLVVDYNERLHISRFSDMFIKALST